MSHSKYFAIITIAGLFALAGNISAQDVSAASVSAQKSAGSGAEATEARLRIQLVITRFEGEKKLGSLPYTFVVTPGAPSATAIRMGVDAPVPVSSASIGGKENIATQYQSIGTNIDCFNIRELPGGRYQFDIRVQNSAALPGTDADANGSRPLFRRFEATFNAVLRDGQSMQTIASSDPVTGEVVKIDVTLNVVR